MSIKNKNKLTRRKLLKHGLYGTVTAGLSPALWVSGCSKLLHKDRPNIIFIVIDTLRADFLPTYGHNINTAPYMDSLAREGVVFERVIAQSTWTKTSMASIMTSLNPSHHGVRGVKGMLPKQLTTIAKGFAAQEYQTIGINTNPWLKHRFGFQAGFKSYQSIPMRSYFFGSVWHVNKIAIEQLKMVPKGQPYFLYLHLMDVHSPYLPKPPYFTEPPIRLPGLGIIPDQKLDILFRQEKLMIPEAVNRIIKLYDGEIRTVDSGIEWLIGKIKKDGLFDNTVLAITSDHGEEFLEHGQIEHGKNFYPETYEVPLIFHAPGRVPSGKRISNQVRSIDIAPTLFALADLPVPETFEGSPLLPMNNNSITGRIAAGAVGLNDLIPDLDYTTVVSPEYLYVREKTNNVVEFYDLKSDPQAKNNLGTSHPKADFYAKFEVNHTNITTEQIELDQKTIEQLKSLGYLRSFPE